MKKLICVGALLFASGCIPSLHAIYRDKDLIYEPQLVGEWGKPGEIESWKFERRGRNGYRLTTTNRAGEKGSFEAHLAKCGDLTVLDLKPDYGGVDGDELYKVLMLPLHGVFVVERIEADSLLLVAMDHEWLKGYVKDNADAIEHTAIDGRVILTAQPEILQEFVTKHRQTKGAFSEPFALTRR